MRSINQFHLIMLLVVSICIGIFCTVYNIARGVRLYREQNQPLELNITQTNQPKEKP